MRLQQLDRQHARPPHLHSTVPPAIPTPRAFRSLLDGRIINRHDVIAGLRECMDDMIRHGHADVAYVLAVVAKRQAEVNHTADEHEQHAQATDDGMPEPRRWE